MLDSGGFATFVISLRRAHARRRHMRKLMCSIGIAAEFIDAVDGRCLTNEQRRRYDAAAAKRMYGAEMNASEIGCFLSHMSVYQTMIDRGIERALILEDDIECDSDLKSVIEALCTQPNPAWSVVRLQSSKRRVTTPRTAREYGKPIADIAGRDLCRLDAGVLGGCGYLITRRAAAKMLSYGRRIFMPVDHTLDRFWENGITPYVVRPLPVRQSPCFASEIGERGRALAERETARDVRRRRVQRALDGLNKRVFLFVRDLADAWNAPPVEADVQHFARDERPFGLNRGGELGAPIPRSAA